MTDILRHFLPPLRDGHRVPPVSARGAWQAIAVNDPLRVIGNSLNTNEQLRESTSDIVSVPDVWAQITVFHAALTEPNHPLHLRAIGEWRGLIACFALSAYRAPALYCEVLRLSEMRGSRWAEIVRRLPPRSSLLGGEPINEIGLVSVEGTLIAVAQPLTLLAPSRSLASRAALNGIPWLQDGRFSDPLKLDVLAPDEKRVLASFLERLSSDLESFDHNQIDRAVLLGMSREFRRELAVPSPGSAELAPWPATINLPASFAFNAFRRLERAEVIGAAPSDCLLRLRSDIAGELRGIVLLDLKLDQLLGRRASELRIWRSTTLQMLQGNQSLLPRIRDEAQAEGYLVVTSEQLFLRKLYRADGVDTEKGFGEHPVELRRHLLPISPIVLTLLTPAELTRNLRLNGNASSGTTVDLSLPLLTGGSVTLSRRYESEEALEPPSALASWPNLASPTWRLHLAYTSSTVTFQFSVVALISERGLAHMLASADGYSAVSAARSLLVGQAARSADITPLMREGGVSRALYWLPSPVEAAVLEDQRSSVAEMAGLLLLPQPGEASTAADGSRALVGIDFGTTNTAAYLTIGNIDPIPLRIPPRQITAYSDTATSRDELDRELLPTSPVDVPFQTILRMRRSTTAEKTSVDSSSIGRELLPLRDSLIYFAQQRSRAVKSAREGSGDLYSNLKWSTDIAARQRIELFLAQTVILSLAESAARGVPASSVVFRFSFPEAFRPQQKRGFQAAARSAVSTALRLVTGSEVATPVVEFQTESIATAQYFIHRRDVPVTEGLITLDIGGQTTDIAILQAQDNGPPKLVWRGSFELAGRHMLIDHLCHQPGLLSLLAERHPDLGDLVKALGTPQRSEGVPTESQVLGTELVINSHAFRQALDRHFGAFAEVRAAEHLRSVALTALAGLLDYVGRVVSHLAASGRITPRRGTAVSVCMGGRASLLFKSLLDDDQTQQMLSFLTGASGGVLPHARMIFSAEPKAEVAYGLVKDDDRLFVTGNAGAEPLLGESLVSDGGFAPADSLVASLDPAKHWRIEDAAEFNRFIGRLPELDIRLKLSSRVLADLRGSANSDLDRAIREVMRSRTAQGSGPDRDSSELEPPFIVLLRRLVASIARDDKIVVLPK